MANTRTWYSTVDYTLPDTTTVALQMASILFALKALLKGDSAGATNGPLGAIPAGSKWTCYYSCDGTTAGTANDGVDRWTTTFDSTKIPHATAIGSGARGWMVLKSPSGLGGNGPYYLNIENVGNGSPAYQGSVYLSRNAPTGGTTTARPTATDETGFLQSQVTDTAAWLGGRAHLTIDQSGNFWFCAGKTGSGALSNIIAVQTLYNLRTSADTFPVVVILDPSTGNTTSGLRESQSSFYRGGTGGSIRTRAYNPVGPTLTTSVATCIAFDTSSSTSLAQDQAGTFFGDLLYEAAPCIVCTTTAAVKGLKGQLYDCLIVPLTIATGTRYPATGDVEKICVGSTLIPLTAVPTL